jgi:hypothetical protein
LTRLAGVRPNPNLIHRHTSVRYLDAHFSSRRYRAWRREGLEDPVAVQSRDECHLAVEHIHEFLAVVLEHRESPRIMFGLERTLSTDEISNRRFKWLLDQREPMGRLAAAAAALVACGRCS